MSARAWLKLAGPTLSPRIEWVADTQGDGLGYDIHSFEIDGTDRFIEVKTTKNGKGHPFIITANELATSQELDKQFVLVRVFGFPSQPQFYVLRGSLESQLSLEPRQFVARLG